MSYSRGNVVGYPPGISSLSRFGPLPVNYGTAASSGTWPTANLAIYLPILLPAPVLVRKLGVLNGGTAAGNFDVGVYSASGTRIVSTGSTAQSGTTTEQLVDVTDTLLQRGTYYLACCMDGVTATIGLVSIAAPIPAACGVLTEAVGAVTLPATATWTVDQTLGKMPAVVMMVEATAA